MSSRPARSSLLFGLCLFSGLALAQVDDGIFTDRPDYTDAPRLVPRGVLQWETGFEAEGRANQRTKLLGPTYFRYGLSRWLELRLLPASVLWSGKAESVDGEVGVKLRLIPQGRFLELSLIPSVSIPSGQGSWRQPDAGTKVAWWRYVGKFGLSGNVSFFSIRAEQWKFFQNAASFSVTRPLFKSVEEYWEVYTLNREDPGGGRSAVFQTGAMVAVGYDAQFDISVGRRITGLGPDWRVFVGWSMRHWLRGARAH